MDKKQGEELRSWVFLAYKQSQQTVSKIEKRFSESFLQFWDKKQTKKPKNPIDASSFFSFCR